MRKIINFTDKVLGMINLIQEKEGHRTFSSTVHSIISRYYDDKYFTKWKEGIKGITPDAPVEPEKQKMTPPEICEYFGGTVDKKNLLGPACLQVKGRGATDYKTHVPLREMGIVGPRGDFTIDKVEVVDE